MSGESKFSSVPTPPPLPLGVLKNWSSKENSNTAPQNGSNANPTAIPQVTHPVQPPSCNFQDELKKELAKRNQEAADDRKQPEGQTVQALSPKPIVQG
ncbi:MAG: hypothetical protein PG981_000211 [Wolbachia endosymbiont of Ctenocephalides orientis wCori]|nr:MAG: hypothetical protein PG981_000211 [Wolbachia endosymbiont of Ctenocephalides orientis wCori]